MSRLLPLPDFFQKNSYDDQHDSSKDSNEAHDVQLPSMRESISDTECESCETCHN